MSSALSTIIYAGETTSLHLRLTQLGEILDGTNHLAGVAVLVVIPRHNLHLISILVDCAHEVGAKAVIRGLRPLGDFESEYQMAQVNKRLGGVETLLMTTSDDCASISSSIVRQVAAFGGDISPMVPEGTAQQILAALSQK